MADENDPLRIASEQAVKKLKALLPPDRIAVDPAYLRALECVAEDARAHYMMGKEESWHFLGKSLDELDRVKGERDAG